MMRSANIGTRTICVATPPEHVASLISQLILKGAQQEDTLPNSKRTAANRHLNVSESFQSLMRRSESKPITRTTTSGSTTTWADGELSRGQWQDQALCFRINLLPFILHLFMQTPRTCSRAPGSKPSSHLGCFLLGPWSSCCRESQVIYQVL